MDLESVKSHKGGNMHLFAANKHATEQKLSEAPPLKARLGLNKALFPNMQHLFCTVHAINRPHTNYEWLGKIDIAKGLEIGDYYRNPFACCEFTSTITDVQWADIKNCVAKSKFLSVIVDGSTDSAITDNEMVYLQSSQSGQNYLHQMLPRWMQNNIWYCTGNWKSCSNSEGNTWLSKLVAFGSDGASVMLGCNADVFALLKQKQPALIAVHCCGHCLELAYKYTVKKMPSAEKVVTLFGGLYYMYQNSPLNRTNLKNTF